MRTMLHSLGRQAGRQAGSAANALITQKRPRDSRVNALLSCGAPQKINKAQSYQVSSVLFLLLYNFCIIYFGKRRPLFKPIALTEESNY